MLPVTTPRVDYVGNGLADTFAFNFPIRVPEHLEVFFLDPSDESVSDLVLNRDFTVIGGNPTGSVKLTAGALSQDLKLTIRRKVPLEQDTNLGNQGPYHARNVEGALDYDVMIAQMLKQVLDVVIQSPRTEVPGTANLILPPIPQRAGGRLVFDADGNVMIVPDEAVAPPVFLRTNKMGAEIQPTGNGLWTTGLGCKVTLTPGTWRVFGSVMFDAAGTPDYTGLSWGYFGADSVGGNAPTQMVATIKAGHISPPNPVQVPGPNINEGAFYTTQELIVAVSVDTDVWLVPYTELNSPSQGLVGACLNAQRISLQTT